MKKKNLLELVVCYQIVITKFIIWIVFLHCIHFPSIKDLRFSKLSLVKGKTYGSQHR